MTLSPLLVIGAIAVVQGASPRSSWACWSRRGGGRPGRPGVRDRRTGTPMLCSRRCSHSWPGATHGPARTASGTVCTATDADVHRGAAEGFPLHTPRGPRSICCSQRVAMFEACGIDRETQVAREQRELHHGAELGELAVIDDAEENQSVLAKKLVVGHATFRCALQQARHLVRVHPVNAAWGTSKLDAESKKPRFDARVAQAGAVAVMQRRAGCRSARCSPSAESTIGMPIRVGPDEGSPLMLMRPAWLRTAS